MSASNSTEKCLKNYLYDNPELQEVKAKKACSQLDEDFDSDTEIWILQCPKDYNPQDLMNIELCKVEKQSNMKCTADRFDDKKTLSVIAATKSDYELIKDNMKLVKPVGKIIVYEKLELGCLQPKLEENRAQKRSMLDSSLNSSLKKKKSKHNT